MGKLSVEDFVSRLFEWFCRVCSCLSNVLARFCSVLPHLFEEPFLGNFVRNFLGFIGGLRVLTNVM